MRDSRLVVLEDCDRVPTEREELVQELIAWYWESESCESNNVHAYASVRLVHTVCGTPFVSVHVSE
jgi:hypothetical protein